MNAFAELEPFDVQALQRRFADFSGQKAAIYFAPGRINLIGEHVDYAGGLVLPASLALGTWVAIAPRSDATLRVRSENQDATVEFPAAVPMRQADVQWSDYVKGVAWALSKQGHPPGGANLLVCSNIPLGSGLSSSAALEVAVGLALLDVTGASLEPMALARVCQTAENSYVGARCGLMDQFAATHGQRDSALLLDCATLAWRALPLPKQYSWVVSNSMVRHANAAGEYNARRNDSEVLVEIARRHRPQLRWLRELDEGDVDAISVDLSPTLAARLRHIVSEHRRVIAAVAALESGDMTTLGRQLTLSHQSLRDDYAVSCLELDAMVEIALEQVGVLGARMMGGGFGGSVLSLVERRCADSMVETLYTRYARRMKAEPWMHICAFGGAAQRVA